MERFLIRHQRAARIAAAGSCLLWRGAVRPNRQGEPYGVARNGRGDVEQVARIVYREEVGEIPEGEWIRRTCGRTLCVEPTHLEAVTPAELRRCDV